MKKLWMGFGTLVAGCMLMAAPSQEELVNLPAGPNNIKYDKDGLIVSVVVVGKASVPDALQDSPSEAAEACGAEASDNARKELVKFLSTKVSWGKDSSGNTAIASASAAATDANGKTVKVKSSSFKMDKVSKEQMAQRAQSCVSGLRGITDGMDRKGQYVWVGVWDTRALKSLKDLAKKQNEINAEVSDMGKAAKAKKAAEDANELDAIKNKGKKAAGEGGRKAGNAGNGSNGGSSAPQGDLRSKSSVASDANDFF